MTLATQPRIRLATLPTPLQELPRLRDALGGAHRSPRILIKRDDLTGLALGGNKVRKLEFVVADAVREGATVLVTTGAAQSNHARMTAASARAVGMGASLVLTSPDATPAPQGNLLLDYLFGAEVHIVVTNVGPLAHNAAQDARVAEVMDDLRSRGERPYLVALGASDAIGTLGYASATQELATQLQEAGEHPLRLYYASGSRGTQAGLALGAKMFGMSYEVHGIAISPGDPEKTTRAVLIANEAATRLGVATRITESELITDQRFVGDGYGIPTRACQEAIELVARSEAILLDPVYTSKAMSGLIADIREGVLAPSDTVVFLHTGGVPAIFAQVPQLGNAARPTRAS